MTGLAFAALPQTGLLPSRPQPIIHPCTSLPSRSSTSSGAAHVPRRVFNHTARSAAADHDSAGHPPDYQGTSNGGSGDDGSNGAGHGDAGGNEGSHEHGDGGRHDGHNHGLNPLALGIARLQAVASAPAVFLGNLKALPGPYIAFLTAIITTLLNNIFKFTADAKSWRKNAAKERADDYKKKANSMRAFFEQYYVLLLHSAGELSERLYDLGKGVQTVHDPDEDSGALYTSFLIARFLAAKAIFRQQHPMMDFGRPSADRLFVNLLRRISTVLSADGHRVAKITDVLDGMEPATAKELASFHIFNSTQGAVGEIMRQSRWSKEKYGLGQFSSGGTGIYDKIIAWPDFLQLYKTNSAFQAHMTPILDNVVAVGAVCSNTKPDRTIPSTRLVLLQITLIELIDFLDPRAKYIYTHRRRRLWNPNDTTLEMPESMKSLYDGTAKLMAGDIKTLQSLNSSRSTDVRVYTTGPTGEIPSHSTSARPGPCPFTQRVVWFLKETGINYRKTTVSSGKSRPSWYLNLHSEGILPVIEHKDTIIEDSPVIVQYLTDQFPKQAGTLPQCKFPSNASERTLLRFRKTFYSWITGKEGKKSDYKSQINNDLERLNTALVERPDADTRPFFGGERVCDTDMALLPHLHHLSVAGRLKKYSIPDHLTAVHAYLQSALGNPNFIATLASDGDILTGYRELQAKGPT